MGPFPESKLLAAHFRCRSRTRR